MMQLAPLTQPYCPHSFSFPLFHHLHPPAKKEGRKEGRKDRERGVEKYVIM
tara:strand:- start:1777 stop:1929 length:153 start_codon:yes stop_codon:yes gene_type:complete